MYFLPQQDRALRCERKRMQIMVIYDDDDQTEWLIREIGDKKTAVNMIQLAVRIGTVFDYPIPVVTESKHHGKVGIRYERESNTIMVGFGLSVGNRD